jgi:mono/diheme cytochrome c family protein
MQFTIKLFVVLLTLGGLMTLATSVALAQDPENGKVLWEETVSQCAACHGTQGEGVWGKPLAGDAEITAEAWIAQVRTPRNRMPSFSETQITDAQITDMQAYISSLSVPSEFGFKDADLADDAPAGQVLLVEKRCVACHGTTGPLRGFQSRNETPTAEAIITQLRTPRNRMPSYNESQVSDAEAAQIAEFIASQLAPQALPESGGSKNPTTLFMVLPILFGCALLATGLMLRRRMVYL